MIKPMVGTRIPQEWVDKLTELSRSTGMSQSELLYQAIGKYLGEDVSTVTNELTDLRCRLELLEQGLGNINAMGHMEWLERGLGKSQSPIAGSL